VNSHDSTGCIKSELWSILHALKSDEIDLEKAEQMISALDSLRELERRELSGRLEDAIQNTPGSHRFGSANVADKPTSVETPATVVIPQNVAEKRDRAG
jgi:hypothetical protein